MKQLLVIYACTLIGGSPIAEEQKSTEFLSQPQVETNRSFEEQTVVNVTTETQPIVTDVFNESLQFMDWNSEILEKELVETEVVVDNSITSEEEVLSIFDVDSNISSIVENEIELGFDTSEYLPSGFDPYATPTDIHSINFIEIEDEDLGFDTEPYLPEGFNPHKAYFNIHDIEIVEKEEDLDVNTAAYLDDSFDPYTNVIDIHSINFIDMDDEIELGFDTRPYLPEGFDPYKRSI